MTQKRSASFSKGRYRNLKQFQELTDEEFDEMWDQRTQGIVSTNEYESRIENKIKQFSEDYDLDDLKANDKLTLRALAQAYITLEDYEIWSSKQRNKELSLDDMLAMDKLGNIMSNLRRDISNMQTDLNITRRVRKSEREEGLISTLESLKSKAKEFYQQRMTYVWCPECNMLLFTGWFHYANNKNNKLQLQCERCQHKFTISSTELMAKRGVNIDSIPEFFK